jgi:hypothetical protein
MDWRAACDERKFVRVSPEAEGRNAQLSSEPEYNHDLLGVIVMYAKPTFKPTAFDHLESREVLSAMTLAGPHAAIVQPHTAPQGNTMKNMTQDLNTVYNAYVANGGNVAQLASQYPMLQFQGNSVSVTVKGKGNFNTLVADLRNSGMQITASSALYDLVIGYVPVTSLPTIANLPETGSIGGTYRPPPRGVSVAHTLIHPMGGAMISSRPAFSFHVG